MSGSPTVTLAVAVAGVVAWWMRRSVMAVSAMLVVVASGLTFAVDKSREFVVWVSDPNTDSGIIFATVIGLVAFRRGGIWCLRRARLGGGGSAPVPRVEDSAQGASWEGTTDVSTARRVLCGAVGFH